MTEEKTAVEAKPAPAAAKPAAAGAPAAAPAGAPEAVKNCAGCNKPIKKAKRFYRNGKYYCSRKCAKTTIKAGASPKKE